MLSRTAHKFPSVVYFLPLLAGLALSACGNPGSGFLSPVEGGASQARPAAVTFSETIPLDITLTVKQGKNPNAPLLAGSDPSSDSLDVYIDVAVTNAGPENVYLPEQARNIVLQARIRFLDLPFKKSFDRGRLKLVVGWTDGGLQASEVRQADFGTDSVATFAMALTRADSFHVADNVAIYGLELADDRFIHAARVVRFEGPELPPELETPAMIGYVERFDPDRDRLYVSGATVVLTDGTRIEDADGTLLSPEMLNVGSNNLTITALAWAYADGLGMIANGWQFTHFAVQVARPFSL